MCDYNALLKVAVGLREPGSTLDQTSNMGQHSTSKPSAGRNELVMPNFNWDRSLFKDRRTSISRQTKMRNSKLANAIEWSAMQPKALNAAAAATPVDWEALTARKGFRN